MGYEYSTDEAAHALVIDGPDGTRRLIGGPGSGAGEFRHPRGLYVAEAGTPADTRVFVCDAWNHRVQVLDGLGRFCLSFGGPGTGPGQFDVPSDVCLVSPRFAGEDADVPARDLTLLAIADRWNCRIQICTAEGAPVASVGRRARAAAGETPGPCNVSRAGWPFFHTGRQPALWYPTRLAWRDPWLDVTCAGGRIVSIDLAPAMLPDFDQWLERASSVELNAAKAHFGSAPDISGLADDTLARIARMARASRSPLRVAS